jgi:hypothetical protein
MALNNSHPTMVQLLSFRPPSGSDKLLPFYSHLTMASYSHLTLSVKFLTRSAPLIVGLKARQLKLLPLSSGLKDIK